MPKLARDIVDLFRRTITGWIQDSGSRQAAALAYYGIMSLAPLLIVAITIAGLFFGRSDIKQDVLGEVSQSLGNGSADLLENVLNATYDSSGGIFATALSVLLLLIAATNLFFQLKTSLNRILNVDDDGQTKLVHSALKLLGDRMLAAVMVIGVGFALLFSQLMSTLISLVISYADELPVSIPFLLEILNTIASVGFTAIIISLIFRFLPDKKLGWRQVWVGSIFTAILFAIGQRAIGFYLENSSVTSAYGVAGSLIVILLWIYYSSSILLFGAEFTQAFGEKYGSEAEEADSG